jgi:hypothetical protein
MERLIKMIESHPAGSAFKPEELAKCIIETFSCSHICITCADACLSEDMVKNLVKCIRLNLDCAEICQTAGNMLSRVGSINEDALREQLRACVSACDMCGSECRLHKEHEHCMVCADKCFECRDVCEKMLSEVPTTV